MRLSWLLLVLGAIPVVMLIVATPLSYYCNPCGHKARIPLQHYREVLENLSSANISRLYIRHDVDACADRLYPVLELEWRMGFNSTICLYPVINRPLWFRSRQTFDWGILHMYCTDGWVVSYHLNAYERAGYDPERGDRIALRDLRWLTYAGFPLDRFSPHGGFAGGGSLNNYNFSDRFIDLSGLWMDLSTGYDYYFSDTNGAAFSVPKEISGSVYLLVHPEWYG